MKKSIILTLFVCVVILMMAACGSAPAKKDDAVVEKSEVVQQEVNDNNIVQDKQSESSEKDEQVSEKDLEDISNLIIAHAEINKIFLDKENITSSMIEEAFKKAISLKEEFSCKIAKLPSIVDAEGVKFRKEYLIYLFEYHSIVLELEGKRMKLQKEIEQIFNDLNEDKNKDVLGEVKRILNEWSQKQMANKAEKLVKRIEEQYGVKEEEWRNAVFPEEQYDEENQETKRPESQEKSFEEYKKQNSEEKAAPEKTEENK